MGTISYWMTGSVRELEGFSEGPGPLTLAEVLSALDVVIERVNGTWVLLLEGFPRGWFETKDEAQEAALRWDRMSPSIEHAPGTSWLVYTGDQHVFSATSRAEAEAFVMGIPVGQFFEQVNEHERQRRAE